MGVIADYINTPEEIKKGRQWMCNAQSEKVVGDIVNILEQDVETSEVLETFTLLTKTANSVRSKIHNGVISAGECR